MYFVLKKRQLRICKNWRVHFWPVTWELTLGFDRLKTTPDRSALEAGCTTTLSVKTTLFWCSLLVPACCSQGCISSMETTLEEGKGDVKIGHQSCSVCRHFSY